MITLLFVHLKVICSFPLSVYCKQSVYDSTRHHRLFDSVLIKALWGEYQLLLDSLLFLLLN